MKLEMKLQFTNNTKTVVYSTTSKAPTEHTKADFSNSLWTTLSTKAGTVDNTYSINSDNTLSTGVWYGIMHHIVRQLTMENVQLVSFR